MQEPNPPAIPITTILGYSILKHKPSRWSMLLVVNLIKTSNMQIVYHKYMYVG